MSKLTCCRYKIDSIRDHCRSYGVPEGMGMYMRQRVFEAIPEFFSGGRGTFLFDYRLIQPELQKKKGIPSMKKTTISTVCLMLIALLLVGCGVQSAPAANEEPPVEIDVPLAGGWGANEGDTSMEANPEAQAALEKALEGLASRRAMNLIACLGTQMVAGTNYCLLCRITPVVPDPTSHFALVYVYQALDGAAEILTCTGSDTWYSGRRINSKLP